MLEVVFHRDSRNRLSSIFARGHTDFGDAEYDLVCAAVSAILQAARLGLEDHVGLALEKRQRKGVLSIRWPERDRDDERVRAIAATAELAVAQIARQYPKYVACNTERETG